jgi:hypothetical protein
MKDFYYILGLDPDCNLDEIKEAYRKLSKKLPPDLNQGDEYFENRFKDIQEAFETLRDPLGRRLYDEQLNKFRGRQPEEEAPTQTPGARSGRYAAHHQYYGTKRGRVGKRGPGVGLSITMIILGCIFGIYAVRWLIGPKAKRQVAYVAVDSTKTLQPVHKKHKRKHTRTMLVAKSEKRPFDTAKIVTVKPSVLKPAAVKPAPLAAQLKPQSPESVIARSAPDSSQKHSDYLYATYVHPNVTGIVQMREHDRFNSNIVASIPANSRVFVLEKGSTYYRVFYEKSIGFVPKWALKQQ